LARKNVKYKEINIATVDGAIDDIINILVATMNLEL
jgi:hypothetical protein